MELLLATTNEGKIKEFSQLLKNFLSNSTTFSSLISYPFIHDISENGKSFLDNSLIKAKNVFQQIQKPTLSDDSGLVIDALNGNPGIYSARYGSQIFKRKTTMNEVMEYILQQLSDIPLEKRSARFVCAVTFINTNGTIFSAAGFLEGSIAFTIQGEKGFGYDPIFIPNGYHNSLAMLSFEEKNTISHRFNALHALFKKIPPNQFF